MDTFENMFDKEISVQMSKRGSMGVADFMAKAVKQQIATPTAAEVLNVRQTKGMPLHPELSAMPLQRNMGKSIPLSVDKLKPLSMEPKTFKINGGGS
jgi:Rod binding domain-containing protein